MPKNSYKLVTELSRSQRFRRFKSTCIENNSNISCIASSSNSHVTNSNLTNTSQDTSKSIPITSNSINQCNKYNLNNLNDLDSSETLIILNLILLIVVLEMNLMMTNVLTIKINFVMNCENGYQINVFLQAQ